MGIVGEGDGLGISDNDTELLFELATECFSRALALLDLATRVFPETSVWFPCWPLRDQHLVVLA